MIVSQFFSLANLCRFTIAASLIISLTKQGDAQIVIPGSGQKVDQVGDDFEDPDWEFILNYPKSSREQDKTERYPTGYSKNGVWTESLKRGMPDLIKRVPTPPGGLPGSKGALRLQTLFSGLPNQAGPSLQDDLIMEGTYIHASQSPSCVVRVYLPPFEEWEDYTGTSFGLRASLSTTTRKKGKKRGFFGRRKRSKKEAYWPGFFIQFNSKTDPQNEKDSAVILIRADEYGQDLMGPEITKTGWWTFGMSVTPDGRVHYFASPGVDDLTMKDYLASTWPYGYRAESFGTIFFNICNKNDGKNWSTEWIIDDPTVYMGGNIREARRNRTRR